MGSFQLVRNFITSSQFRWGSAALITLIVIPEVAIWSGLIDWRFVYRPSEVVRAIPSTWEADLWTHLLATLGRTLFGFSIAAVFGSVVGVLTGSLPIFRQSAMPIVDLLRPLPSSAIIPLVILVIGLNETAKLFVIVFGSIWPIIISTHSGVFFVNSAAREAVSQLHFRRHEKLIHFTLPEAAPEIATGMKVSMSIALILSVTSELLIGGGEGLGKLLNLLEESFNYPEMYVVVATVAALGLALNISLGIASRLAPWIRNQYHDAQHDG